jgi:hypothetical protein
VLNLKGSLDKSGGFEVGVKNTFLFLFGLERMSPGPQPVSLLLPYTPEFGCLYLAECGELSHFEKQIRLSRFVRVLDNVLVT